MGLCERVEGRGVAILNTHNKKGKQQVQELGSKLEAELLHRFQTAQKQQDYNQMKVCKRDIEEASVRGCTLETK